MTPKPHPIVYSFEALMQLSTSPLSQLLEQATIAAINSVNQIIASANEEAQASSDEEQYKARLGG